MTIKNQNGIVGLAFLGLVVLVFVGYVAVTVYKARTGAQSQQQGIEAQG